MHETLIYNFPETITFYASDVTRCGQSVNQKNQTGMPKSQKSDKKYIHLVGKILM